MTIEQKVQGRFVGVLGLARSGMAALRLAARHGARLYASDAAPAEKLKSQIEYLQTAKIPFETGAHTEKLLDCDYLVLSPGVPLSIDVIHAAREKGIPIFSELEFASWFCRARIVAITGSNGKTTTSMLLGEILKASGRDTVVCGNIGLPFSEVAENLLPSSVAVVEVSTFQLETIADFRPSIAALLNLSPDHLDRHDTFDAYQRLKCRITENQAADDYLILNHDDSNIRAAAIESEATRLAFSVQARSEANTYTQDGCLFVVNDKRPEKIIEVDKIAIPGPHNLQNAAAAALVASILEVTPSTIASVLASFPGVEHRLETVGQVAGITFINDSKATNVDSVRFALLSMKSPVYLIAGGRDKGASYSPIIEGGQNVIRGIIAIGEARQKIFEQLGKNFPVVFADTMEEAVERAFEQASPGQIVLLSPGCASFDMFENFEQRGEVFRKAVRSLKNNSNETISR